MKYFTTLRKQSSWAFAFAVVLLIAGVSFGQTPPPLGSTATYAAFSGAGAIGNTGLTHLTGDIGTNAGAFTGFPPGMYTGAKHVADPQSLVAKNDLTIAWNQAGLISCDTTLNVTLGNGQVLTPRTYCLGPASTLTGNLTFDAKGNSSAIFVVKIGGALNAAAGVHVILANGAQAVNIYWRVDGAVSILDNSIFKGTIIANGAIHMYGGTTLEGRALSLVGAVTMASNTIAVPVNGGGGLGNTLTVVRPAPGDTIVGGTQKYQITWAGTGIAAQKTFDFSLDSGKSWTTIGTITADTFLYSWNVPDTSSTKAIVRITDKNGLTGMSGLFVIASSKPTPGTIVIVTPAAGEVVNGKTQNYQITWSGSGIASKKTFDYSLDGGITWTTIGTLSADVFAYSWNVPDTASTTAMVRITDGNGAIGKSGLFIIKSSKPTPGSIVVLRPAAGETIAGGTQNYQITWSGSNIGATKNFEYSLDGGATWNYIGILTGPQFTYTWASVPNVATTTALIRITDVNHDTGVSGLFTITKTAGVGSINSLTLTGLDNTMNIGNNKVLGISWTFTPDIGTSVELEYSLDYTVTWNHIATVSTSELASTSWTTTASGYYNPVFIRITSSKGMTRLSDPFSIGSTNAVAYSAQSNGYSIAAYPNPARELTSISYILPVASDITVNLTNELGEVVNSISKQSDAGTHSLQINTSALPVGTYNYSLQAGTTRISGKMMIVK